MSTTDHTSREDDIRDARDAARDQEFERRLRWLLRTESSDPAMEQQIKEQLHAEWSRLYRKHSGPSLNSR